MPSSGIGAILKADASNTANELDLLLIDEIRNQLFGIPNAPGTDLAAVDSGRVAVTPIHFDLTDRPSLEALRGFDLQQLLPVAQDAK